MDTKAVLFDLDGTLVDSLPDIHAGVCALAERRGLPKPPIEDVGDMIGKGIRVLIERLADWWRLRGHAVETPEPEALLPELIEVWSGMPDLVRPIPGAFEAVAALRAAGIKTALVTNKIRERTVEYLERNGLEDAFDAVVTASDCERAKPWPDILWMAAEQLQVDPKACVMVGDSQNDALAGRAAGMRTVLVRTGYNEGVTIDEWAAQNGFEDLWDDVPQAMAPILKEAAR